MESYNVLKLIQILYLIALSLADVSHFFAPEFGFFQSQLSPQYPFALQPPPPQAPVPSLYAAPPPPPPAQQHPDTVTPKPGPTPTPAPVAPTTTTEFVLPEVIENRSLREHFNFIPLQAQYLPPEERPNYESPKPPQHPPQPPSQGYLPPQYIHKYYTKATDKPFFGYSNGGGGGGGGSVGSGPNGGFNGYYYPRPTTTTTTTTSERPNPIVVIDPPEFVPPINYDPNSPPPTSQGYDYNAPPSPVPTIVVVPSPPSTPAPVYLPPPSSSLSNGLEEAVVVEHSPDYTPLRLHVQEMRCMQHEGGYFRSVLKVDSFIGAAPSVDNDSNDKRCELKLSRSYVVVDVSEEDFHKCGVHSCGTDLCLRLRFPTIRGMRTGSDAILTLHCKTQDRVAVKTHALKMGVANDVQARSIGTYAHGGTQNPFRTHIELLRKSPNGFTRHLESNGVVQLGEELLLRAHVLAGDGWNYTKLTDVSLQRVSPSGELLNNANLITTRGCVNPSMHSICTQPPLFDPPLGHRLAFKAVMFQGMRSGDELVLSMRITGCLEHHDCHVSPQECNMAFGNQGRRKRNISLGRAAASNEEASAAMQNATEISEISRISFRVIMQDDGEKVNNAIEHEEELEMGDSEIIIEPRLLRLAGALGFVTLLTCLGIFAILKLRK